jgi:ribosome maturation factor RimP
MGPSSKGKGGATTDATLAHIREIANRVAASCGVEIFDVQLRREPVGLVLRIFIDRPTRRDEAGRPIVERREDSIGIEECQRVSQDVSAILDVEDAIDAAYTLEVSSPGLERSLRDLDDYARFAGRMAKIVVREPVDGQVHFEGRVTGIEDGAVVLAVGRTKVVRLPYDRIARGRLAVEF